MSDERIVEVIGEEALAALRAAGFDVYRPEACATVAPAEKFGGFLFAGVPPEDATHRLVPIGGDS